MWALLAAEITDAEISNNNNNDFNDVILVIFSEFNNLGCLGVKKPYLEKSSKMNLTHFENCQLRLMKFKTFKSV